MTQNIVFGDSVSVGSHTSDASTKSYVPLVSAAMGIPFDKSGAAAGDWPADQAPRIFSLPSPPSDGDRFIVMGFGDGEPAFGTYQTITLNTFASMLFNLAIPDATRVKADAMTLTGTWNGLGVDPHGKSSGAGTTITAECDVEGSAVLVQMWWLDGKSGLIQVDIDDESYGPISLLPPTTISTYHGATIAPVPLLFTDLPDRKHHVKITKLSGSSAIYLSSVAGLKEAPANGAKVVIGTMYPMGPTAVFGSNIGINTKVQDSINCRIYQAAALVNRFCGRVAVADISPLIDPAVDLYTDQIHPIDSGHAKIAPCVVDAFSLLDGDGPYLSGKYMQRSFAGAIRGKLPTDNSTLKFVAGVPTWC